MPVARKAPALFGEADLESEALGESDSRCSYPPPGPESGISELRGDERITLRAPAPSSALLELSGIEPVLAEREEPLRETREPFRLAVGDSWPHSRPTAEPPPDIEDALRRAARSSFASIPLAEGITASDRPSGVRISDPHSIEEAVLRVIESAEPLPAKIPKA